MSNTEYQEEYGSPSARAAALAAKKNEQDGPQLCSASLEKQPVGGMNQFRHEQKLKEMEEARKGKMPAVDGPFVATSYSGSDRGTHRVQPHWRDPRWSDETRANSAAMYEPADRDPCQRQNFYLYRWSPSNPTVAAQPLAVPDVHKLRYMHNNYMTGDDWY